TGEDSNDPRVRAETAKAHTRVGGAYHLNQMWGGPMARRAAEDGCDLLLDGLAFDTILGGVFQNNGGDVDSLVAKLEIFDHISEAVLASLGGREYAASVFARLRKGLRAEAERAVAAAGKRASEWFVMRNRIRKYTFGYCLANLAHLPGRYPYVTPELFDHCLRLPLALRDEHRLYRRIYLDLFPRLARIPWAKTGLPLDRFAPPKEPRWRLLADAVLRRLSWGRWTLDGPGSLERMLRSGVLREVYAKMLALPSPGLQDVLPDAMAARAVAGQMAGRNLAGVLQGVATVRHFLSLLPGGG
ncbi:MAG: hypothetical protein K2W96_21550, partial [Gemmataceae bacterium]|nr:hypothetical protein [Gemmataceae bacterium]